MALWRDYRRPGWRGWALPFALVATGATQAYILRSYEGWDLYLTSAVAILCLAATALLVAVRLVSAGGLARYAAVAATVGGFSLFIAPAAWAGYTVVASSSSTLPTAGPTMDAMSGMPGGMGAVPNGAAGGLQDAQMQGTQSPRTASGPGGLNARPSMSAMGQGGMQGDGADTELINYLERNQGNAEYLVAGMSSMNTASIILSTDEPVIDMGGFSGGDPVFTVKEISNLVESGKLRYFLIQDQDPASSQPSAGDQSSTEGLNDGSTGGSSNGLPDGSTSGSANGSAAPPSFGQQGMPPQMPQGARQGEAPPGMAPNYQQPGVGGSTPRMPQGAWGADSQASGSNNSGSPNPMSQGSRSPQSGTSMPMGGMPGGGFGGRQTQITRWVKNNCEKVPASVYGSSGSSGSRSGGGFSQGGSLYACGPSTGFDGASSTETSKGPSNASDAALATASAATVALAPRRPSTSASAAYGREA